MKSVIKKIKRFSGQKPSAKIKIGKMQERQSGVRCPVCDNEIDMFIADAGFTHAVQPLKVTRNTIEVIEDVWNLDDERCYCPKCGAMIEIAIKDAQRILRGEAILVDPATDKIVTLEIELDNGESECVEAVLKDGKIFIKQSNADAKIYKDGKWHRFLLFEFAGEYDWD